MGNKHEQYGCALMIFALFAGIALLALATK